MDFRNPVKIAYKLAGDAPSFAYTITILSTLYIKPRALLQANDRVDDLRM